MNLKVVLWANAIIFSLVFLLHLLRLLFSWEVQVEGFFLPLLLSFIGLIISGVLVWANLRNL